MRKGAGKFEMSSVNSLVHSSTPVNLSVSRTVLLPEHTKASPLTKVLFHKRKVVQRGNKV
jgi:hypothetical protein